MKTLLVIVLVQSLNLVVFLWFNRLGWLRILALGRQFAVYKRKAKKPKLRNRDRLFWELEVKFGIHHASSTVRRYMVKRRPPSDSQAWRSFLKNNLATQTEPDRNQSV